MLYLNSPNLNNRTVLLSDGLVRKRSQMQLSQSMSMGEFRILKKSSSCSTIYIDDSTVSNPNLKVKAPLIPFVLVTVFH